MTRHPVKAETIPEDLRGEMPVDERGRVDRPAARAPRRDLPPLPRGARAAARRGQARRHPLPAAAVRRLQGRPRSTTSSGRASSSAATRCWSSSATARGWTTRTARRASPSSSGSARATSSSTPRARTRRGISSRPWWRRPRRPRTSASTAATSATWNKRGGSAAERFDYLYSDEELEEWVGPLRELAGQSEQAYAFFNNNASSEDPDNPLGRVSQAATNAQQLRRLLDVNRIAASGGHG